MPSRKSKALRRRPKSRPLLRPLILVFGTLNALHAAPQISDHSPDKKYALRQNYAHTQPYNGDVEIIETRSGKPIVPLETEAPPFNKKLLWSKDSMRVAYFNDAEENGRTRIFVRTESGFAEVKLPELPTPQSPAAATQNVSTRLEPLRWMENGDLILENETQSKDGMRAAVELTFTLDQSHTASVVKSEPEAPSIVDYFLLLPADQFEGPPSIWLRSMRHLGGTIDRKNGYMSCAGDGALAEFEVALFRYKNGRPLLALCTGELEGADSTYLRFFEMAHDGKMQPVGRWLFPVPDGGYDPESGGVRSAWTFQLPRTGKTIAIRQQKNGKVLSRLTWNGERFEKEK